MLGTFQIHSNLSLISSILALVDLLVERKDLLLSKQNDGRKNGPGFWVWKRLRRLLPSPWGYDAYGLDFLDKATEKTR